MGRSLLRSLAEFVITKVFPTSKAHVLPRTKYGVTAPKQRTPLQENTEETGKGPEESGWGEAVDKEAENATIRGYFRR
jgi:hypothetical protein